MATSSYWKDIGNTVRGRLSGRAVYTSMDIAQAAQIVVDRALIRLKTTNKLILALGENHNADSHRLLCAKVLSDLQGHGIPVTLALEEDNNFITRVFEDDLQVSDPHVRESAGELVKRMDTSGHLRAKTLLALGGTLTNAPLDIAVRQDIPVIFADAARKNIPVILPDATHLPDNFFLDTYMDLEDPKTRRVAENLGYLAAGLDEPIRGISVMGVHLRNACMVESCLAAPGMQTDQPHVVVLQTGRAHINGSSFNALDVQQTRMKQPPRPKAPYDQSLAALFAGRATAMEGASLTLASEINATGLYTPWHAHTLYLTLPENDATTQTVLDDLHLPFTMEGDMTQRKIYMDESIRQSLALIQIAKLLGGKPLPPGL